MPKARSFALVATAVALSLPVAVVACSEGDDEAGTAQSASMAGAYRGLLTGPTESGVLDVVIGASSSTTQALHPRDTSGAPAVTGTITMLGGGGGVSLTGTYDASTGVLTLTGTTPKGSYTLTGTSTSDGFSGTYSGPSGSGSFSLASSTNGAATLICGSARSAAGETIAVFNFVVDADGDATGASCSEKCNALVGKVEGTTISLRDPFKQKGGATGTFANGEANGTWTSDEEQGTWSGSTAACQASSAPPTGSDAGEVPADGGVDADAGGPASVETLLTGLAEPVSMAVDTGYLYWLSGASAAVERCALPACATSSQVATGLSVPSSVAATNGTVYWTNAFRYVMTCAAPANGTCVGTTFADLGDSAYPAHLATTADRIYWISESGQSRRVQTCPLAGCTTGYPKTVYASESPAPLHNAPISGFTTDGTNAYFALFSGGIYRLSLSTPETANAASVTQLQPSAYATAELDLDGTTLRWGLSNDGKVVQCTAPLCATVSDLATGRKSPVGTRSAANAIYGFDRGVAQAGGIAPSTGSVWRIAK